MDKPKVKLTSIALGSMLYHEPVINDHEVLSESHNAELLSKRPATMEQIQKLICEAQDQEEIASRSLELLEARFYLQCALKLFDEASRELIVRITHQRTLHRPSELEIFDALPEDPEFLVMEGIQRQRSHVIQSLAETLLCLIELYIQNQLWYSTTYFFDELNLLGMHSAYDEKIVELRERVARGKMSLPYK